MPAFSVAPRRKRRRQINTIRLTAIDFGVHERTLRRWIARPELKRVLRAYQHGKQTRLDVPETDAEFDRYKQEVLSAVRPFHRKRVGRVSPWATQIARSLGFGNKQRERDLPILQAAAELKLAAARPTSVFKAKSKLATETGSNRATQSISLARSISAKYRCAVIDVPEYLNDWIAESPTRERKNAARRLRQSWPSTGQWGKANNLWKSHWLERTLTEAARECIHRGQRISGPNLVPLLFHNPYREHAWKTNQKLKRHDGDHFDPYGKRGISLSLFRQRYDRKDIQKATRAAEG